MQRDLWNKKVMKDVKNMSRVFDSQRWHKIGDLW
jgi:hypothetical protein